MTTDTGSRLEADFERRHRVRWRETDASGFLNFANYICVMEETEYAFLRSHDLSVVMRDQRGVIGFPRVSTKIELYEPARLEDELDIRLCVAGNDGVKIEYKFAISRGITAIASGQFGVACCRFPPGQPPRAILVPDFFMQKIPLR